MALSWHGACFWRRLHLDQIIDLHRVHGGLRLETALDVRLARDPSNRRDAVWRAHRRLRRRFCSGTGILQLWPSTQCPELRRVSQAELVFWNQVTPRPL